MKIITPPLEKTLQFTIELTDTEAKIVLARTAGWVGKFRNGYTTEPGYVRACPELADLIACLHEAISPAGRGR